jgi:hypothetical protein
MRGAPAHVEIVYLAARSKLLTACALHFGRFRSRPWKVSDRAPTEVLGFVQQEIVVAGRLGP